MPDGRFISYSLGDSEKYAALDDPRHQVAFVLLTAWADAEGRFIADPVTVNGKLLTRIRWATPEVTKDALIALHVIELVRLYEVDGKWYGYVEKFHEHNKIRRREDGSPLREAASKLPAPPPRSDCAPTAQLLRSYCAVPQHQVKVQVEVKVQGKGEVKNTHVDGSEPPSQLLEEVEVEATPRRARVDFRLFEDAWEQNRGPLPRLLKLNDKRREALRKLVRENGGDVAAALDLFRDATLAVAHDEFWQRRQYGFDNLMRQVDAKAEQWRNGGMRLSEADRRMALETARMAAALEDDDGD